MHLNLLVDYLNAEWIVHRSALTDPSFEQPSAGLLCTHCTLSRGELVSGKKSLHELNLRGLQLGRPLTFTEAGDDLKLRKYFRRLTLA